MSVQIAEVLLGTKTQGSVATEKKRKATENITETKQFQLKYVGEAGEYLSVAGEIYMQAGN